MKYNNKRLFSIILVLLSPLTAQAASQAGGVPDLATRVTILENSLSSLQTTVTNLQQGVATLQTTVANLQNTNSNLQAALAKEVTDRINSDNTVQANISQETVDRKNADASLQNTFDLKVKDAIAAIGGGNSYSVNVIRADVPNGNNTSVAVLDGLPSGRFVVFAKGEVLNVDHDTLWGCSLVQNDATGSPLDSAELRTEDGGVNANNSLASFSLMHVVEMVNPGKVQVFCDANGNPSSDVRDINIIALEIAN